MKRTLLGIVLFLIQISLAIVYNGTIDLIALTGIFAGTFVFILYKYVHKKYDHCEL